MHQKKESEQISSRHTSRTANKNNSRRLKDLEAALVRTKPPSVKVAWLTKMDLDTVRTGPYKSMFASKTKLVQGKKTLIKRMQEQMQTMTMVSSVMVKTCGLRMD